MTKIKQFYEEMYHKEYFQKIYQKERLNLYKEIATICNNLKIRSCLDIGCSYGFLVEYFNEIGINAYGLDLPIAELKQGHKGLRNSQGKFFYGSVDDGIIKLLPFKHFDALVMLDTLRYIANQDYLMALDVDYIVLKEVSNNLIMQRKKRSQNERLNIRLYSPLQFLKIFDKYKCYAIYPSKYIFNIKKPSKLMLALINILSPTYTLILIKK